MLQKINNSSQVGELPLLKEDGVSPGPLNKIGKTKKIGDIENIRFFEAEIYE